EQLKRLNTDHIDFYMLHALGVRTWPKMKELEAFSFLERAKKDGRIRHAGFSFHDTGDLYLKIVDHWDWDFTMIQFNYMDEQYQAGRAGLERAKKKGMGIVAMEPLRGGLLARPLPEEAQKVFDAAEPKRTNAEWAFRWLYNDPGIHVVLSGMSAMAHVKENISVARTALPGTMSAADLSKVASVQKVFQKLKAAPCTECRYCMPCPFGVDIPKNLMLLNDYYINPKDKRDHILKRRYKSQVPEKQSAKMCTSCDKCLKRCPQKIPIPARMKEIVKLLG
ncbi:aldo/keto reductase, partial [Myxococcota bacterium]|nr:aldo/keto reductase [Myxococcota bacterium]